MAFLTPAGTPYIINDVVLRLNSAVTTLDPVLTLWSDNGANRPDAMLHTFTDPASFGTGIQNYTFTGDFELLADTKYWLLLSNNGSNFDWKASSPAETPTGIASHAGSLFSTSGGSTWSTSSILTSYQINATAVPEPATLAALGLGALAVLRRRNRR